MFYMWSAIEVPTIRWQVYKLRRTFRVH